MGGNSKKPQNDHPGGRWDKHDAKDSANIADLISQGKCLYYEYPEMGLRDLRTLLSLKKKLKKQEHSYRVRIRNEKEPGIRPKRWVKLSAKFLIIAWTIMKIKEPYNPCYLDPA
jgi:hypothetical protein